MRFRDYLDRLVDDDGNPLTQSAYGARIGAHQTTIMRLVNGKRPTAETMKAIFDESGGLVAPADWYPEIGDST